MQLPVIVYCVFYACAISYCRKALWPTLVELLLQGLARAGYTSVLGKLAPYVGIKTLLN